jgi:transposase-like protein
MTKAHEQHRQRAIDRYLAGDPIEDICRELACSKSWLYKWRDRYLATAPSWSAALSRRPRTTPTKTPQRIAQVVVALRQTLAQHGTGCGAAAIQQALAQQGIEPVPSLRTIYRILHCSAKEVTSTNHHHPSVHQRAKLLPVLTEPPSQGNMAT